MLRRKHISLLLVLVAVALCTATGAVAGVYTVKVDGSCSDDDPYTCSTSADGWVVEILTGVTTTPINHAGEFPVICSGTDKSPECVDKKGNPITGYRFAYEVTAPAGSNLVQADLLASICSDPITKTYPTDQSVKFLSIDPNTGYAGGTSDFVIAWTALKLDPSNKANFSVYTTRDGAGGQGMQLQTGTGLKNINKILGPVCCTGPQNITSSSFGSNPDGSDNVSISYDQCTGVLDQNKLDPKLSLAAALWHCNGPFGDKLTTCALIKRMGPASGSFIDVTSDTVSPGSSYIGTRYYGYGNKFYKAGITGTFPTTPYCGPNTPSSGVYEQVIIFDNNTKVTYNQCGDATSVTDKDTGTPYTTVTMYIYESADDLTKPNPTILSGGLYVNGGPSHGGIFEGTRCYYGLYYPGSVTCLNY
jgi:hypothetical protein